MALIQVFHRRDDTHQVGAQLFHLERLVILLRVMSQARVAVVTEAVVDTGSHLSVFPQRQWERFQHDVQWLTDLGESHLPHWLRQFSGACGGRVPFRLGTITVEFFSSFKARTARFPLTTMFAFDDGLIRDNLIGLGGGAFSGRKFEMVYDTQSASLSDLVISR